MLGPLDRVHSPPLPICHLKRIAERAIPERAQNSIVRLEPAGLLQLLLSNREEDRSRMPLLELRSSAAGLGVLLALEVGQGEGLAATVRCCEGWESGEGGRGSDGEEVLEREGGDGGGHGQVGRSGDELRACSLKNASATLLRREGKQHAPSPHLPTLLVGVIGSPSTARLVVVLPSLLPLLSPPKKPASIESWPLLLLLNIAGRFHADPATLFDPLLDACTVGLTSPPCCPFSDSAGERIGERPEQGEATPPRPSLLPRGEMDLRAVVGEGLGFGELEMGARMALTRISGEEVTVEGWANAAFLTGVSGMMDVRETVVTRGFAEGISTGWAASSESSNCCWS